MMVLGAPGRLWTEERSSVSICNPSPNTISRLRQGMVFELGLFPWTVRSRNTLGVLKSKDICCIVVETYWYGILCRYYILCRWTDVRHRLCIFCVYLNMVYMYTVLSRIPYNFVTV